ncbi:DUF6343 family protein [Micromonospora avicenniae]|uniref:Uncharacterized protein n=1 Tax=Micromonospora avicenniae TaxID=1198245 RepID=A0A1N6X5Z4_9ACTN|nr:DUF6343 family protein [Micromonospora avicenniae]SIQ97784.1 hypothetical protein SAMN05444858_105239 [Micromonospora avicenniae]
MTRSQPRRARGTVGHAYSALNLRLALAGFGLVIMAIFAVLAFLANIVWLGVVCALLALVAVVDLVIIQRRRAARRREEPGAKHSLFE